MSYESIIKALEPTPKEIADGVKQKSLKDQLFFLLKIKDPKYGDLIKAIEDIEVSLGDIAYFTSEDDFKTFQDCKEVIDECRKKGYFSDAPYNIRSFYYNIIDQVKEKKRKFLAKAAFGLFLEELHDSLEESSKNLKKKPITYAAALNLLKNHYPKVAKVQDEIELIHEDMPIDYQGKEYTEKINGIVLNEIKKKIPEICHPFVICNRATWNFPFLKIDYIKDEHIERIDWYADIYTVVGIELSQKESEMEFPIAGEKFKIKLDGGSLGNCHLFLRPDQTEMEKIYFVSTPLSLLSEIIKGQIIPDESKIVKKSNNSVEYHYDDFGYVTLPDNFLNFLKNLNESGDLLRRLVGLEFMDDFTYNLVKGRMEPKPSKQITKPERSIIKIKKKDRDRLMKILKIEDSLPYSEWGNILGLTRSGVLYTFRRYENDKLVTLYKNEQGVKIILSDVGREAIEQS